MEVEFIPSPGGKDVMLRIDVGHYDCTKQIVLTLLELHQLDWAIRKYLEKQPLRNLKQGGGHE